MPDYPTAAYARVDCWPATLPRCEYSASGYARLTATPTCPLTTRRFWCRQASGSTWRAGLGLRTASVQTYVGRWPCSRESCRDPFSGYWLGQFLGSSRRLRLWLMVQRTTRSASLAQESPPVLISHSVSGDGAPSAVGQSSARV